MTIQAQVLTDTDDTEVASIALFELKEFLVAHGWTVEGSADGVAAGAMDATDRISSAAVLQDAQAWFVLQSPHASAGDRVQLLFHRNNATGAQPAALSYDPEAAFAGGNATTVPTSATAAAVVASSTFFGSITGDYRMLMVADDAAPYSFLLRVHDALSPETHKGVIAFVAMEQVPTDAGKPYFVWVGHNTEGLDAVSLSDPTASLTAARGVVQLTDAAVPVTANTGHYHTDDGIIVPGGLSLSLSDEDFGLPIPVFSFSTPRYVGFLTSFMSWQGGTRGSLVTFSNRSRVSLDQVSVSWDGSTVPTP